MVKIAICDDNDLHRSMEMELLHEYLGEKNVEAGVTAFPCGEDLVRAVKSDGPFDIYILDMIMPGMNGMEVASTLRYMKDPGLIIFLTSTLEYGAASYDVHAFYYMLKPVDTDRFRRVLTNALESLESVAGSVVIRAKSGELRVRTRDITYVNLVNRVPNYFLNDGRVIEAMIPRGSFGEETAALLNDKSFIRCGVGLVINLSYVDGTEEGCIVLRDGTRLYPSHTAFQNFKKVCRSVR